MNLPSLTLTQDELSVFLSLLGSSSMLGLLPNRYEGLSDRQIAERIHGGEQTLLNRNLVEMDGSNNLILDDLLVALVGTCVVPDVVLVLIERESDGQRRPYYCCATDALIVEQSMPRMGIHSFVMLPDLESVTSQVTMRLNHLAVLPAYSGPRIRIEMDEKILRRFVDGCEAKHWDSASLILQEAGLSAAQAETAVTAYRTQSVWSVVAAKGIFTTSLSGSENGLVETRASVPDQSYSDSLMILTGKEHCWLVAPAEVQGRVCITATGGIHCVSAVYELAQKLLANVHHPISTEHVSS